MATPRQRPATPDPSRSLPTPAASRSPSRPAPRTLVRPHPTAPRRPTPSVARRPSVARPGTVALAPGSFCSACWRRGLPGQEAWRCIDACGGRRGAGGSGAIPAPSSSRTGLTSARCSTGGAHAGHPAKPTKSSRAGLRESSADDCKSRPPGCPAVCCAWPCWPRRRPTHLPSQRSARQRRAWSPTRSTSACIVRQRDASSCSGPSIPARAARWRSRGWSRPRRSDGGTAGSLRRWLH